MKKLFIVATVVAVAFSSCGGGGGRMKTDVDSLSYAIGIDIGHQLKATDPDINPNIVAKGIIDVFNEKETMTRDDARDIQQEYFMVKMPLKKQQSEISYLESVEKGNKNIQKTESGLLYEIIMPGDETMKATSDEDIVKVKYSGRLKEAKEYTPGKQGEEFDANDEIEFPLNRVIKGWTEGLQLVGKGGKIKLWIPSELGYGAQGTYGGPIGPYEPLVFEVELIDVTHAEAEEAEEAN